MSTIALIGAPSTLGGLPLGSDQGPARLREAGIIERLRGLGLEAVDLGDVPVPPRRGRWGRTRTLAGIESVGRWVAKHSWRAIAEGMTPLVIGGDHSAALGNIAAASQSVPGLGLIWIDAHPDFNTPETSPTDNIHGMVLAIAAGWGPMPLVRLLGYAPMVHPERIAVVGARSIDAGEVSNLRGAGVRVFDGEYVERHGARETAAEAVAYLAAHGVRAVHLSVDLDVLDPRRWPGVSTPAPGGLSSDDLAAAAQTVAEMAPIAAMDLVELTPPEDVGGVTAEAAIRVAEAALAHPAGAGLRGTRPSPGEPAVPAA